jgi:hypothetical protein
MAPSPRVTVRRGATVKVMSSFHRNQMSFPLAHPADVVCLISRHRAHDGTTTAIYRTLRRSTITFLSSYEHATDAMDPAMLGRLVVR